MLSVQKLTSAAQASSYFERDNYYSSHDPARLANTAWFGHGAEALGLAGAVEPNAFSEILEGKVPGGPKLGRMVDGAREHTPGIDLTFSAPKSVSLLAEILDDNQLRTAHTEAVQAALGWAEREFIETRAFNRETGKQETLGGQKMVAALFRHDITRALDPDLHTHSVIANMVQGADGKWRSLRNDALYQNKMLLGLVYRSELAANLKGLGYEVDRTHRDGRFELRGFSPDLIRAFSTRSEQIKAALTQFEHVTPQLRDRVALATRDGKIDVDRVLLRQEWREKAASLGFDLSEIRQAAMERQTTQMVSLEEAVLRATNELSERQSAFRQQDLMRGAIAGTLGEARPAAISAAIATAIERGDLLKSVNDRHDAYLTTPAAVALEQATIGLMHTGKAAASPLAGKRDLEKMLAGRSLTEGQRQSVETILTSIDRVVGVQGYAGTGKTTMLETVRELAARRGHAVLGIAPSSSAAKTLGAAIGAQAMTLQKFLARHQSLIAEGTATQPLREAQRFFAKRIVVLDEASMASSQQLHDVLRLGELLNIPRIVLVGDAKQLNAVDAGKPFEQLQAAGMATATMREIMRQTSADHREAVENVIDGNIQGAFQKLGGQVVEVSASDLAKSAAQAWLARTPREREGTLMVATTHQLRSAINQHIRVGLKAEGRLASSGLEIDTLKPLRLTIGELSRAQSYRPGERVLFNRDYASIGVERGTLAEVRAVDAREGKLTLAIDGRLVEWSPSRVAGRTSGAVELFEAHKIELAAGDRISWTRNDPRQRFLNSEGAVVEAIDRRGIALKSEDGKRHLVEPGDNQLRHLDYAWGSTVYRSQGATVNDVIAVLESRHPHLTTQKNLYVEISRARHSVMLVTDDVERLKATLERQTGEPIAALDLVREQPQPGLGMVAAKELPVPIEAPSPVTEKVPVPRIERVQERVLEHELTL